MPKRYDRLSGVCSAFLRDKVSLVPRDRVHPRGPRPAAARRRFRLPPLPPGSLRPPREYSGPAMKSPPLSLCPRSRLRRGKPRGDDRARHRDEFPKRVLSVRFHSVEAVRHPAVPRDRRLLSWGLRSGPSAAADWAARGGLGPGLSPVRAPLVCQVHPGAPSHADDRLMLRPVRADAHVDDRRLPEMLADTLRAS